MSCVVCLLSRPHQTLMKTLSTMLDAERAKKPAPTSPAPAKQRPALQKTRALRDIKSVFTADEIEELKGFNLR